MSSSLQPSIQHRDDVPPSSSKNTKNPCVHVTAEVIAEAYRLSHIPSPQASYVDPFCERLFRGGKWGLQYDHLVPVGAHALRFGVRGGLVAARYNRPVGFVTIIADSLMSNKVLRHLAIIIEPRLRCTSHIDPVRYLKLLIGRLRRRRGPYAVMRWVASAWRRLIPVAIRAYLEWEEMTDQEQSERLKSGGDGRRSIVSGVERRKDHRYHGPINRKDAELLFRRPS